MPCTLNAANEVVNLAFRQGRCTFPQMADVISKTMERTPFLARPTLDDYFAIDREARRVAEGLVIN